MGGYFSDLVVGVSGESAQNDGVLYLLFAGQEIHQSRQETDEGSLNFEVFISIER